MSVVAAVGYRVAVQDTILSITNLTRCVVYL